MPQVLCPVLVGRDDEARRLRTALTAAGTGRGSTLLLVGEAGIGKSRLVRETARMAGERGLTVLAGRAVAGGIPVPYRPFAEALTSAGRAGRRPASEDLAPFRPVLGRLIPEWRPAQPPPGDQPAPGEESPVFLGEAVLRLLRALAPDTGCLLVLEDLHWADRETLALLEYLADNLAAERILCLGTLRAQSPGRSDAGAAALASALAARGAAAVLPLGRLGPAAVADMTRACLDAADLPDQVYGIVAERAEASRSSSRACPAGTACTATRMTGCPAATASSSARRARYWPARWWARKACSTPRSTRPGPGPAASSSIPSATTAVPTSSACTSTPRPAPPSPGPGPEPAGDRRTRPDRAPPAAGSPR